MSDIVARIRAKEAWGVKLPGGSSCYANDHTPYQAANEIEALEAALTQSQAREQRMREALQEIIFRWCSSGEKPANKHLSEAIREGELALDGQVEIIK